MHLLEEIKKIIENNSKKISIFVDMDGVVAEYTKTGENFGHLLVDGRTIPVYTIVNDKTLNEIELNKFLEYNVNKVIEYYNDFKEERTWN